MTTLDKISMKGAGFYATMTVGAQRMIESETETFLSLHAQTQTPTDGPYVVADYGAADGGTSINLITDVVKAQRSRAPDTPVSVYYTDLPGADYNFMFNMLSGLVEEYPTYRSHPDINAFASGISFHMPILPRQSVDIGFSANAMHWLSVSPPQIPDHVHSVGASGDVLGTLRAQGIEDWAKILKHRSRELKPGGKMLFLNFALAEDGSHLGKHNSDGIFHTLNQIWLAMTDDGILTPGEYLNTNYAQYYKTEEEFRTPFENPQFNAELNDLVLESSKIKVFRCIYQSAFQKSGDADSFAHTFVPNVRSWSERTFLNGLKSDRAPDERMQIVDELFDRYAEIVRNNPTRHNMDYVYNKMIVSK